MQFFAIHCNSLQQQQQTCENKCRSINLQLRGVFHEFLISHYELTHTLIVYFWSREHGCKAQRIASPRLQAEGFAMSAFILNSGVQMREKTLLKIVGSPWKEGIVRLEVDKFLLSSFRASSHDKYFKLFWYTFILFFVSTHLWDCSLCWDRWNGT